MCVLCPRKICHQPMRQADAAPEWMTLLTQGDAPSEAKKEAEAAEAMKQEEHKQPPKPVIEVKPVKKDPFEGPRRAEMVRQAMIAERRESRSTVPRVTTLPDGRVHVQFAVKPEA